MSMLSKMVKAAGGKSETTLTVAGSATGSGAGVVAVLVYLRSAHPGLLPWEADMDVVVAASVMAAATSMVSRAVAWLRNRF